LSSERRPCRRASCTRVFLVVASVSVITLAASSSISSAVSGSHVSGDTFASPDAAASGTAAQADCSEATAREVVERLGLSLNDPRDDPVGKVLCGHFTGPGSETMVIVLAGPTGLLDWLVFRWAGDAYQLLMRQSAGASITAAGSDIRQTVSIFRVGDSRCCPSGGTKARIWHWDGTRFTATPWKLTTKPKPRTLHLYYFESPSHNLWCDLGDEGEVFCRSYNRPHCARLTFDGRVRIWNDRSCGHKKPGGRGDPVLAFGQRDEDGRYRCASEKKGITCTVMAGAAKGKGFLINAAGVRRVGP
jgi:hypothetical protein